MKTSCTRPYFSKSPFSSCFWTLFVMLPTKTLLLSAILYLRFRFQESDPFDWGQALFCLSINNHYSICRLRFNKSWEFSHLFVSPCCCWFTAVKYFVFLFIYYRCLVWIRSRHYITRCAFNFYSINTLRLRIWVESIFICLFIIKVNPSPKSPSPESELNWGCHFYPEEL